MKSTASCNKAMLINQASMSLCIDGRQEDLLGICFKHGLKNLYTKIKFEKIFENYLRIPNKCEGLENSLKFKKQGVGIRVRGRKET